MNDIVQWDPASGAALPAHLADAFNDLGGSNIRDRQTVPSLSYEGKTWTVSMNGNKTKLQAKNEDGDMIPISVMRMVILEFNNDRGRAYYEGTYDPSNAKQPDCWSPDGKTPDTGCAKKQSTSCQGCPMSIKGSRVDTSGKESVACSSHRMLGIVPAFDLDHEPLRLKIAQTSDWDKEVAEHGWFAFSQYGDWLKSRGIQHTALVVTKVKFNPNVAYPKLMFALDRLLTAAEVQTSVAQTKNPKLKDLLAERWSAAGVNGVASNDSGLQGLEAAYGDGWLAHPDAPGYSYKGNVVEANDKVAALYPAPEPAAPPPPPPPPPPPAAPEVPAAPVLGGLAAAVAAGWQPHPAAPGYHYLGTDVKADAEVEAMFPSAPPAPPAAAAPPPPPPPPVKTPAEQAAEAGWLDHPSAPGYMYLGQDVVATADVLAKFSGNGASTSTSTGTSTASGAASTASPTDPASPAPSGGAAVPAEVGALLEKWGQQ